MNLGTAIPKALAPLTRWVAPDAFNPPDRARERHAALITGLAIAGAPGLVALGLLAAFEGQPRTCLAFGVLALFGLASLVVRRVTKSNLGTTIVAGLGQWSMILIHGLWVGEFRLDVQLWLLAVPISALLLDEGRAAILWTVLIAAETWLLSSLAPLMHTEPEPQSGLFARVSFSVLCASLVVLAWLLDAARRRADLESARLTEALGRQQRLETVGRLAGGVAHDFNNLLTVVETNTRLAHDSLPHNDPARDDLKPVLDAAARGGLLTRKLLAFASGDEARLEPVDPALVVATVVRQLAPETSKKFPVVVAGRDERLGVTADKLQLELAVAGLLENARDAMPEGGTTRVELARRRREAVDVAPFGRFAAGEWVTISITDTGTGMSEEVRQRLFEPFFTTKDRNRTAGLGLAALFGIVKGAGGFVEIESAPGKGTTVAVSLVSVAAPFVPEPVVTPQAALQGSERGFVLLIEDEDGVRRGLRRLLERAGFTVLDAADGRRAIAAFDAHPQVIDAVLSDVLLGVMNGPEVVAKLRETRPDIGVVYISGFVDALVDSVRTGHEAERFLAKPFESAEVIRAVNEVIQQSRAWRRANAAAPVA